MLGYALGFVGGTDSHDSRPGSVTDGPSHTAHWEDTDGDGEEEGPISQYTGGGLTGAWLTGDLSSDALFDALDARHSVATSGPRPALHAYARAPGGQLYLPGDTVPVGPYTLVVDVSNRLDSATGALLTGAERVGSDLTVSDANTAFPWEVSWTPAAGEWTYVRLKYTNADGTEGRVWVSPWFVE